jgi:two-component system response regulator LytT
MRSIKALVVDDERYAREELTFLLEGFSYVKVVGDMDHGEMAILETIRLQPDVVFLDVEMPKVSGIEVAKSLKELKKVPLIVFATAHPEFAAEAFRINALDYLLKPYDPEQLTQTMERIKNQLFPDVQTQSASSLGKLAVEQEGEIQYIVVQDILYATPDGKNTKVFTKTAEYKVKSSLKELETKLTDFYFFKIHKSYLVNLNHVVRLTPWFNGAYELEVAGRKGRLPVSRNYARELQRRLDL